MTIASILDSFLPKHPKKECKSCKPKNQKYCMDPSLVKARADLKERVRKLEATLDGEDSWFLTIEKRSKGDVE